MHQSNNKKKCQHNSKFKVLFNDNNNYIVINNISMTLPAIIEQLIYKFL